MSRQRILEIFFLGCRILIVYGVMTAFLAAPPVIALNQRLALALQPLLQGSDLFVGNQINKATRSYATAEAVELVWVGQSEKNSLTAAERQHLKDVHTIFAWGSFLLGSAVILSILSEKEVIDERVAQYTKWGVRVLAVVTIISVLLFPAFFETFHQLFFPQGNYAFSPNSLLIQCFPPMFWIVNLIWLQGGVMALLWWQAHHAEILSI